MAKIRSNPAALVALVCAALLAVGVFTFAGPCVHDDGSTAACHTASVAVIGAGVVGALAAVAGLMASGSKGPVVLYAISAIAGAFAAASPGVLFPLCMMQTMHCWTVMRPFALVCGIALCITAVVAAIMASRQASKVGSRR